MNTQDVSKIKKLVAQRSGKLINLTISGAHLYGFESKDSDIDYRGSYLMDTNELLGTGTPKDYIEHMEGDLDVVLFEMKKEITLLQNGNCNVLEHLFAKQLWTQDEYFGLKKIVELNLNLSGIYRSYREMAWCNYKKFCLKGMHTVKKFLYVFRGILAGIYALENRKIEPNIQVLLDQNKDSYFYNDIQALIDLKKAGKEKDFLPDSMLPKYHKLVETMITTIDEIYEQVRPSEKLKDELDHARENDLNQYLKKIRKNYMRKNNGE